MKKMREAQHKIHTGGKRIRTLSEDDKHTAEFARLLGILSVGRMSDSGKIGASIEIDSFDLSHPVHQELFKTLFKNFLGGALWEECGGTFLRALKKHVKEIGYLIKHVNDHPDKPSGKNGNFVKNGLSIWIKRGELGSLLNYSNEVGRKTNGREGINFCKRISTKGIQKEYPKTYCSNDLGEALFKLGFTVGNMQNIPKIRSNFKRENPENLEAFDKGVYDASRI